MSLRVLLLDDDESLARELAHALVDRAGEVVTTTDAEAGLGAASSQTFDVILVSTEIPGANAFELCERLQRDPATASVPLVLMSRTSSVDELVKASRGARIAGFFTKPVAVSDLLASIPERARSTSGRPPGDLRDTIKNQDRVITSMRADLSQRSQVIDRLTTSCKDLTRRLTEVQGLLEAERKERDAAVANLQAFENNRAAELHAIAAERAAEAAERERAFADETAFLEQAHQDATDAAGRRLRDSERNLAAERATHSAYAEARVVELAELRQLAATLGRERDAAIAERDEARTLGEGSAMDIAQARMDLAEETRLRAAEAQAQTQRVADLEQKLADLESRLGRTSALEAELAQATVKLADSARALDAAERDVIQRELARDAAFHEMNVRAAADREAAVAAVKAKAAAEREETARAHEQAIKVARDKAIAQTLAVARERKKQQS